jgi:hypothetical protein
MFNANWAPTLRQDWHYLQKDQNEIPLKPRHLVVPSSASKMIFWAYGTSSANHAPTLHRHYSYLQMERSEIPHDPRHLGVSSGASKTIFEPMVCSTQTVHLSCIKISTVSKLTELSLKPHHLGAPSGVSKTISEPMERLAQNSAPILHR